MGQRKAAALAATAHPGPSLAVTTLAALLTSAYGGNAALVLGVIVAVLSGQLVIGWSNDLIDADRDARDARGDKPLATGVLTRRFVGIALGAAAVLTVVSSLTLGAVAGLLHLVLVVGSGLAYNLGLKATVLSFVPYALAFGALPAVGWYAVQGQPAASAPVEGAPPAWMLVVGALLGVGAHLLNALPDLQQDQAHGIHGLPHRLGAALVQLIAPALLLVGAVTAVVVPAGPVSWWGGGITAAALVLAVVAGTSKGMWPFRAAIGIALLAVAALLAG
ncbi:MAG: UbiA family prenyltransferase [Ornithinimicrobium sp.]